MLKKGWWGLECVAHGVVVVFQMCEQWGDEDASVRDELILTAISLLDGGNSRVQAVFSRLMKRRPKEFIGELVAYMTEVATMVEAVPSLKVGTSASTANNGPSMDVALLNDAASTMSGVSVTNSTARGFAAAVEASFEAGLPEPPWEAATNLYRLLQVLVEGHYLPLQNFFREFASGRAAMVRARSGSSAAASLGGVGVSVVSAACEFLESLAPRLASSDAAELCAQVLDTLIELVQGPCHENQLTLINNKVRLCG